MRDWIIRNLPQGFPLPCYRGISPGDLVHVIGWTSPGSVDVRRVVALRAARCDQGVMVVIDEPLKNQIVGGHPLADPLCPNGYTWVAFGWTREGGKGE